MAHEKNPIWERAAAGIIVGLVLWLLSWAFGLLPRPANLVKNVASLLLTNLSVPCWTVILLCLICTPTIWRLVVRLRKRKAPFRSYCEDCFLEVRWRWNYSVWNHVVELQCFCIDDDTELSLSNSFGQTHLRCETCGRSYGPFDGSRAYLWDAARRQVERKIRTGEWEKSSLCD